MGKTTRIAFCAAALSVAVGAAGSCKAPLPPAPQAPPAHDGLSDPQGPVELWGAWLEELASPELKDAIGLARGFAEQRDLEGALEVIDRAGRDRPREAALHAARAGLLYQMGFPRAAEGELEIAVAISPESPHLWWGLATVRERLRMPRAAGEAMRNARSLASR